MKKRFLSRCIAIITAQIVFLSAGVFVYADYTNDIDAMEFNGHNIPAYDGDPYEVIEDEPCFTSPELIPEPSESYGELDSMGRCTSCFAVLNKSLMPTYKRTPNLQKITPTGWIQAEYAGIVSGSWLYNRSHLIGFQLTGVYGEAEEKKEFANQDIITGTKFLNVGGTYSGMDYFENRTAAYLKKSEDNYVAYRVTPVFKDDEQLARGVIMEAKAIGDDSGAFEDYSVFIYNVQPGVAIDYATGDSKLDITAPFYGATVDLASDEINYTGDAITPRATVIHNGGKLVEGEDYTATYENNVEIGTATVEITGIGRYWGTVTQDFRIVESGGKDLDANGNVVGDSGNEDGPELSLADAKVTIPKLSYAYSGSKVKPTPTVKYNGKTLEKGTDYLIAYGANKSIGPASVTVTGIGDYCGKKTVSFTIVPRNTSFSKLTGASKAVKVKWKKQSIQTTGYQLRYSTKSNMSGAKTVRIKKNSIVLKTIKNLKHRKRYYVQIRTYKKVGTKYYYSPWGTRKSIVTK